LPRGLAPKSCLENLFALAVFVCGEAVYWKTEAANMRSVLHYGTASMAGLLMCLSPVLGYELKDGAYQVFSSDDIQEAVNAAVTNTSVKTVEVHEGTYLPRHPGQALVYLNRKHDGVHLRGVGKVVLSAANPAVAKTTSAANPAIVNHVLYLGDGLSSNTVVEHFQLTGANHFVTTSAQHEMEPDETLPKGRFYYGDGGAIKIYRRSYPVLRDLEIVDNYASPCAGGISIQQEGETNGVVWIENCVFKNNRAEVTGGALDLLWGSSAYVTNCLFVGNLSNAGPGEGVNPFTNNGVVTVFPRSKCVMIRCTLIGNRNGVDDLSGLSEYRQSIFLGNQMEGGTPGQQRFELDLQRGGKVEACVISGLVQERQHAPSMSGNLLNPAGFRLDADFVPQGPGFENIGYRPTRKGSISR
jgi:hypothetical protein